MKNVRLILEYDGTNYCGWQRQNNGITVQGVLEKAIKKLTNEDINVLGSSRTDSGVHAKGFVCNFKTESSIPAKNFKRAINTKLPDDIVVIDSEEVEENFHARFSSKGKTYCYTICNRENAPAIGKNYMYYFQKKLNIDNMKIATKFFIGTHDFNAFRSLGSVVKNTTRTIIDLKVEECEGIIKIWITGDGFLYNMVRIIVGTLIRVGTNKLNPESVKAIIDSKDRNKAGKCAPARGLCLEKVYY